MKVYFDETKDNWIGIPQFIDVLRDTYDILYEAYNEEELTELIKNLLRKELAQKY